jgi:hypothetical protein
VDSLLLGNTTILDNTSSVFCVWSVPRLYNESVFAVESRLGQRSTESRTTETGELELENRQSKATEEEMTRRLHSDLK